MKYTITLQDTITTAKRTIEQEDIVMFNWLEGNYSCDCNRSLFLWDFDPTKELPCGDGRIAVEIRAAGEVVYADSFFS